MFVQLLKEFMCRKVGERIDVSEADANANPLVAQQIAHPVSEDLITPAIQKAMEQEDAGRPGWYGSNGAASQPAIGGYTPATGSYQGGASGPAPQGGGAWADPLNYIATNGSDPSGSGIAAGGNFMGMPAAPWTCANGCSNDSEIFAFHTGGSNVCFGDGSVRFVRNGLTMTQAQALLSRAGGEVINFDY